MTLLWPPDLPLVIHPAGISTLDVQEWIQKNHAPVSRINCAPGTDNRDFNDLVKSLRNCGGVSLREVSTNLLSHALIVCDCVVGSRRQLSGTASPHAAWHGSARCSLSCQRHPGSTDVSIAWARPHEALCGPELTDAVQTSASRRSGGHARISRTPIPRDRARCAYSTTGSTATMDATATASWLSPSRYHRTRAG